MATNAFRQDLRYALSSLRRAPMLVFLSVISIALGIGANTAIFSLIHSVLLKPLNYPEPDRLARLWETFRHASGQGWGSVSTPNLFDWRKENDSFEQLGGYSTFGSWALTEGDRPIVVRGARLEPEAWAVIGQQPLHGRLFEVGENSPGRDQLVILSHSLWQGRFSGDPTVVNSEIRINGKPHVVVGIMPFGFQFPARSNIELWTPLTYSQQDLRSRGNHWLSVVGRLKPGVSLEQASLEMAGIGERIAEAYPDSQDQRGIRVQELHESLARNYREALWTLWGAVALVLLIGCANVANLLLAKSVSRRRELAVRAALGASRGRIVQQMLTESLLLAAAGGVVGLALGYGALRYLAALPGSAIPQGQTVQLDPAVLAFCLTASLATAVLAGIFPALRSSRSDITESLKQRSSDQAAGSSRDWLRSGLVVAEVALSVVVLVGSGLLLKSYSRLLNVDTGIATERLLTLTIPLPSAKYSEADQLIAFYRQLQERAEAVAGVEKAGLINLLPMQNWGWNGSFMYDGMPELPPSQWPLAEFRTVAGDYFETMKIPLLAGEVVSFGDGEPNRKVMVNRAFARQILGVENPVGRRLAQGVPQSDDQWMTIVGMVGDVRNVGLERDPQPEIYFPLALNPSPSMSLVLRTSVESTSVVDSVRRIVKDLDAEQPIHLVKLMDDVIVDSIADRRFNALLMGVFAGVALLLAVAGVYGVLSYGVGRRRYEFAVRMALGARRGDVFRLVTSGSLLLAGLGIVLGSAAALWLTGFMESQLYGIQANDPGTLGAVCLTLLGVSLVAALIPARKATRVDPVASLRGE